RAPSISKSANRKFKAAPCLIQRRILGRSRATTLSNSRRLSGSVARYRLEKIFRESPKRTHEDSSRAEAARQDCHPVCGYPSGHALTRQFDPVRVEPFAARSCSQPTRIRAAAKSLVRIKTMAIKATFTRTAQLLTELGDAGDNTIVTTRDAAGQILRDGAGGP